MNEGDILTIGYAELCDICTLAFYNIYMYLYNKNVLEYAQIARSGPKFMIRNIEGNSIK